MSAGIDCRDLSAVARAVRELYGRPVELQPLPGELDLNFKVRDLQSGVFCCLKISHAGESRERLEMQHAAMAHLHSRDTVLQLPVVIPGLSGQDIFELEDHQGDVRLVRMLSWVEGRVFADVSPHRPVLLERFGACCAELSRGFSGFAHPQADRFIKWDPRRWEWILTEMENFSGARRALVERSVRLCSERIRPLADRLRMSVNYNDANDYNVLVSGDAAHPEVAGVIDFGDLVHTWTVNELAIGMAYAVMHKPDPVEAASHIVRGYHRTFALTEEEIAVLHPLMVARLLISVTCSELNRKEHPENAYLQISDAPAWEVLEKMDRRSPDVVHHAFRLACGLKPVPAAEAVQNWLKDSPGALLMPVDIPAGAPWLDLGIGNTDLGTMAEILDVSARHGVINALVQRSNGWALGRYGEYRPHHGTDAFVHQSNDGPVWRSRHLGLDFFCPAGTSVRSVWEGEVKVVNDDPSAGDHGPAVVLLHRTASGVVFHSLYGRLSPDSITGLKTGDRVSRGQVIGIVGDFSGNGLATPHLHLQFLMSMPGSCIDIPGACAPDEWPVWHSICPDPWWWLTGSECPSIPQASKDEIVSYRRQHLGKNLSISYKDPLIMLRGDRQYLIDHTGRRFLDTVNNVAHVGHEHPRVVRAGQRQMAVLNTNTRYLHPNIIAFTETFLSTLPPALDVLFLVNSGSEANELAIRLARTFTGQRDMIVSQVGYHGNTNACVEVSSYKFDGPGGKGAADHIHVVPIPDVYRGLYRDADAGIKYAAHVGGALSRIRQTGRGLAAFLFESVISCGGQVELPAGFLKESYRMVRAAGGLCIADEVQTGCGRAGDHYWAFEAHGVVPDILTIGKPIGNGHPLGVVATTQEVAEAFRNGMEFFNTFGGNPVSCAIGKEVLDVIREEGLQEHARITGEYLKTGLRALAREFPVIGDVRGTGLFLGFELVTDPATREPAAVQASWLANRMRDRGILMSTDGPYNNVMKIKPPMVFSNPDADFLLENIRTVLQEDVMRID